MAVFQSCAALPQFAVMLRKPDELGGDLVAREVTTGLDDLAQLRVDIFNRVRNRHDIGGASRSRAELFERMV